MTTTSPPLNPRVRWQGKIANAPTGWYSANGIEQCILCPWSWYFTPPQPADLITPVNYDRFNDIANGGLEVDQFDDSLPTNLIACCDLEDQWRAGMDSDDPEVVTLAADKYFNAIRATKGDHPGPIDLFKVPAKKAANLPVRTAMQRRCTSASWSGWRTQHPMQQAINIMAVDIDPLVTLCAALGQPLYLWCKPTRQGHDFDSPAGIVPLPEYRTWMELCKARWPIAGWIVLGGDSEAGRALAEVAMQVMA